MTNITNTFSIHIQLITYIDFIIGCYLINYNEIEVISPFGEIIKNVMSRILQPI